MLDKQARVNSEVCRRLWLSPRCVKITTKIRCLATFTLWAIYNNQDLKIYTSSRLGRGKLPPAELVNRLRQKACQMPRAVLQPQPAICRIWGGYLIRFEKSGCFEVVLAASAVVCEQFPIATHRRTHLYERSAYSQ